MFVGYLYFTQSQSPGMINALVQFIKSKTIQQ